MPWRFQRPIPFTLFHFDRFRACSFFPALSDWLYCLQFTLACLHTGLWLRFWWQPKAEAHMRARRSEPSLGRIEDCSKTCSSIDIVNATMPWRFRHESFSCCMMIDSGLGEIEAFGDWMGASVYGRTLEAICTPLARILWLDILSQFLHRWFY